MKSGIFDRHGRVAGLRNKRRASGQSITEFVIVIPVLLLLLLGCLQFALIYVAKSTLNQAAFTGARLGAVKNADECAIRRGVVKGLTPLFQGSGDDTSVVAYGAARIRAWTKTSIGGFTGLNKVEIDVLNPSKQSFTDFSRKIKVNGKKKTVIPNSRLLYRDTTQGSSSHQTIQDANLLKIRVHYCYPLIVPPVKLLLAGLHGGEGQFNGECYAAGGTPLQSDATILMQSDAYKPKSHALCVNPF